MTALVQSLKTQRTFSANQPNPLTLRSVAIVALALAVAVVPEGVKIAGSAIVEAYLAVSVFVAATLVVLYAAEDLFRTNLGSALANHRRWQVPAGALLGVLPGCGGAIVAVTQFTRGALSFGGIVATLTSTMGDAMFLLLAREPTAAGIVMLVSAGAGIATGYVVDAVHGRRFMQPANPSAHTANARLPWVDGKTGTTEKLWFALLVPGVVIGMLGALQIDIDDPLVYALGLTGGLLAVGMWLNRGEEQRNCADSRCAWMPKQRKVIDDTNFVTSWVIFAFVGYELFIAASGVDLADVFSVWAFAVPAVAILIGFIPGCGPQIITTSLYLDSVIPLSAQLGNAISNDGDALFPAIAKAPKAAALATLYSAVPAVIVSYGTFAFGL